MFCKQCGNKIEKTDEKCSLCNTRVGKGGRFCEICGTPKKNNEVCAKCASTSAFPPEPQINKPEPDIPSPAEPKQKPGPVPKPPIAIKKDMDFSNPLLQKIAAKGNTRNLVVEQVLQGKKFNPEDTSEKNNVSQDAIHNPADKTKPDSNKINPEQNQKPQQKSNSKTKSRKEVEHKKESKANVGSAVTKKAEPEIKPESPKKEKSVDKKPLPPLPTRINTEGKEKSSFLDSTGLAALILAFGCAVQTDIIKMGIMGVLSVVLSVIGLSRPTSFYAKAAVLSTVLIALITIGLKYIG